MKTIRNLDEMLLEWTIPTLKEEINTTKNKIEEELKTRS